MVNAADGDHYAAGDVLDEAAERRAFQEAVAEWRRSSSGGNNNNSGSNNSASSSAAGADLTSAGGGLWQNPFAAAAAHDNNDCDAAGAAVVSQKQQQPSGLKGGDLVDEEEAEKAAFRAAVADWRSGGAAKVAIVREYLPNGGGAAAAATATATAAAKGPQRVAVTSGTSTLGGEPGAASVQILQPRGGASAAAGASLMQGALDEEQEHREFVRAVEAWRTRGSGEDGKRSSSSAMQSLAEQLSQQLELEQRAAAERLQQQKRAAEERLRQVRLTAVLQRPLSLSQLLHLQLYDYV